MVGRGFCGCKQPANRGSSPRPRAPVKGRGRRPGVTAVGGWVGSNIPTGRASKPSATPSAMMRSSYTEAPPHGGTRLCLLHLEARAGKNARTGKEGAVCAQSPSGRRRSRGGNACRLRRPGLLKFIHSAFSVLYLGPWCGRIKVIRRALRRGTVCMASCPPKGRWRIAGLCAG